MEWDTPMDRMLRERAAKAREKAAAATAVKPAEVKPAGAEPEPEAAPETIIIMPNPQQG